MANFDKNITESRQEKTLRFSKNKHVLLLYFAAAIASLIALQHAVSAIVNWVWRSWFIYMT